jgi:DNA-directed RNA polymerase subunit RPC12/RpoP
MSDYTLCDMPMAECPYCSHRWQLDDYYDLEDGVEIGCPDCEHTIVLSCKDVTVTFHLETKETK